MANLQGYDASNHEPLGDFEALPKGEYRAMATDSEMKDTKAGTGSYLQIVWELLDEEHQGRKLWSRLNLDNPNTTAVEIAQRELSSICRATGVLRPKDSAEFHNIPVVLKVGVEKRKDTGEFANRVQGYVAIDGATEQRNGESAKPPWKR